MQHILIPTDFSENAWNAIQYALKFFNNKKVTFHLLHIDIAIRTAQDNEIHSMGFKAKRNVNGALSQKLNDLIFTIETLYPNLNFTLKKAVLQVPFIEGIRSYIAKKEIDLIIMGTKGASGLKEMTIGSRAGAVITKVKCPILVIPEKAVFKVPVNIGFPTDFNLNYKHRIINTLLEVAEIHNASIKILRVAQNEQPLDDFQNRNRDVLNDSLKRIPHSFHVIENPNLESGLQAFINTMKIDMIAMIAKNLNFFQRILFRPKVTQISYHMQLPFLVLHE